jgi:diadenosine tetraphosphate (Ap4A) HIT family hydrolase
MMGQIENCLGCKTLTGRINPPGGVIYEDDWWLVDHILPPIFIPGSVVLKLKRHCEHLAALNRSEASSLGPNIQSVSQVVQQVTHAEKIHVASYGEGVKHIHFLITPRTADLPASNIRLTLWLGFRRWLFKLKLSRREDPLAEVSELVNQLRFFITERND